MDPNQGNPYLQGSNPFMQGNDEPPLNGSPNAQTPVSGGEMDAGMAPPGGGTSETTKPRQMPGGADPMGGMPAPGGAPAMTPLGGTPTTDTNVPQQPQATARARLRTIRSDIRSSNPEISLDDAHLIAMRVVALQDKTAASPMGPAPTYTDPTQQKSQRARQRVNLNPRDPESMAHPGHPQHRQYLHWMTQQQQGQQAYHAPGDGEADDEQPKAWQSQYGGRTPLEDRAYMRGYQGQNPNLFGLADTAIEMFRQRNKGKQPPATRHGQPGARQLP